MSGLAELQRDFAAALHDGEFEAAARRVRAAGVLPADRLALYRRNMHATQHDALAATYPVVRRLVGDAFFRVLALDYLRACPSRSGNLDELGDELARFVAAYPPASDLPYLADIARLEWACHESALAAEAPSWDAASLADLAEQDHGAICLRLHPSVRLLDSGFPVVSIWEANQPGRDGTLVGDFGAQCAITWRAGWMVRVRSVEPVERSFLDEIRRGATLEAAVTAMRTSDGVLVAATLERLACDGVIAGLDTGAGAA
jgi:hypothetical protein